MDTEAFIAYRTNTETQSILEIFSMADLQRPAPTHLFVRVFDRHGRTQTYRVLPTQLWGEIILFVRRDSEDPYYVPDIWFDGRYCRWHEPLSAFGMRPGYLPYYCVTNVLLHNYD